MFLRLGTLRRRHELGTDGIADRRVHDELDERSMHGIERPTVNPEGRLDLIRVTATPERDADALVEHPTHRQMNHAPAEAALREIVELPNGVEILRETRRLKFWVDAPQIVAVKSGVRLHASAQQSSTKRTIAERHDVVGATVRQYIGLAGALEQVVGRLQHMRRGHLAEALHLGNREVADVEGTDFSLI